MEAKMTVKKAIAIWKYNSGVHGINEMLDNNYKDVTLHRFALTLKKHVQNQNMLSFLAVQEYASQRHVPVHERQFRTHNMAQSDGGKFFKNYSSEFIKLQKPEDHRQMASLSSQKHAFDKSFKMWLVLKKFLRRRHFREQSLSFTFWRQYSIQFSERLKLTMNRLSQTNPHNFTLIQTLAVANAHLEAPGGANQQNFLQRALALDNQIHSGATSTKSRQRQQLTSRRRWENPQFKTKFEQQALKCATFTIKNMLKRRILRDLENELSSARSSPADASSPDYLQISRLHNYFRHWKRSTRLEEKKQRLRKAKFILKRINDNIYLLKMETFVRWLMAARRMAAASQDEGQLVR